MAEVYKEHFGQVRKAIESQGGSYGFYEEETGNSVDGRIGDMKGIPAIFEATIHPNDRGEKDITRVIITVEGAGAAENGRVKFNEEFGNRELARIEIFGIRRGQK